MAISRPCGEGTKLLDEKAMRLGSGFPDEESIRTIVWLATRAPSVHNTQPWLWRVGENSLHLYCDKDRSLPATDPDQRDLIVSCGAALHHAVVALAAHDRGAQVHRFPNPGDPTHLAALELVPRRAEDVDFALAAAIARRRTDRRIYTDWPVPAADIAVIAARVAHAGATLRQVESLPRLKEIVDEAAWRHSTDPEYMSELSKWSGHHASDDGVLAHSTPQPEPAAPLAGRVFAGPALPQPPHLNPSDDGAVVIALGTKDDNDLARLQAGEATSAALLTATAFGMASCPVTEPLEIAETRELVRAEVFDDKYFPQMMLRIGWAPINGDELPPTPRRPLQEVVSRLDGSPL